MFARMVAMVSGGILPPEANSKNDPADAISRSVIQLPSPFEERRHSQHVKVSKVVPSIPLAEVGPFTVLGGGRWLLGHAYGTDPQRYSLLISQKA